MNTENSVACSAWIGLGSNMGDREHALIQAVTGLHQHDAIEVEGCSALYETDPVGYTEQDSFLNMVVQIRTLLHPEALLAVLLDVEKQQGRVRTMRWGPRTLDLDLLAYEHLQRAYDSHDLILPHPRMHERGFVLVPLVDVLKQTCRPEELAHARKMMDNLEQTEGITRWKTINWQNESVHFAN
ncbi:2-amino-4-hydroxy-6-hydroxymethyldihydropteridine diphosphokinase [Marinicrinis sediminis]|uniref:2-amino-4-hydroxy-6-hydroxymethyldihydropteridine diphosphokinase n=1 Tax=Marinicrinis sediminis TaxID=1652465 RepID=A0ABW5R944_9BACL